MFRQGQRPRPDRYAVTPRSLVFLLRGDQVLLLRLAEGRGAWAGRMNGLGGHIEAGEDPYDAARREVVEETGLIPGEMRLAGAVLVDVGTSPGIGIYVFVGTSDGEPQSSVEGQAEWVPVNQLGALPLVQDLPELLPLALACYRQGSTFTGVYRFDEEGQPLISLRPGWILSPQE